jgi:hypothetical protein
VVALLAYPMREVGALLDANAVHGGRSAYNHLLCLTQTNNLPKRRMGEVLELVGLTDVARKRTKGLLALLASTHDTATLSQPNVLRAVVGSALYVTVCGLFAFAIGAILRHTAGTITAVIGLLFVIPIPVHLLPQSWYQDVERWLPDAAGRALSVTVGPAPSHLFSAWNQFLVFAVYTAVLLVVGAVLFRKRDA